MSDPNDYWGDGGGGTQIALCNIVAAFGVDNTGATDINAGGKLAALFALLVASGQAAWFPAGNYKVATPVRVPSGLVVWGNPSAIVTAALGQLGNPSNAPFFCGPTNSAFVTTLAANNTVGAASLSLTAAPAVGSLFSVASATATLRSATYKVLAVSGMGPFAVTTDRPVLKQFAMGDAVQGYSAVPTGIQWWGNGMSIGGDADRMIEFAACWYCNVDRVNFSATTGSITSVLASFDVQGLGNQFSSCTGNGNGVCAGGLLLESNESSRISRCSIRNITETGIGLWDCDVCGVEDGSGCTASEYGVALTADGNTIGCNGCWVRGGIFSGNTVYGVLIDDGSSNCVVAPAEANSNGTYGIFLSGTGAMSGNVIQDCTPSNNGTANVNIGAGCVGTKLTNVGLGASAANYGAIINAEVEWSGLSNFVRCASGTVLLQGGPYSAHFTGINCAASSASPVFSIGAGIRCTVQGAHVDTGNAVPAFVVTGAGAVLQISDTDIANASIGIHATAAGTARIGHGVKCAASVTTPVTVDGGSFCNKGTVVANGVSAVALAFPDIGVALLDNVKLTSTGTSAVGDAYLFSQTPGTGFSIKSEAGDTNTYNYEIS